jgi:hypothetical protein
MYMDGKSCSCDLAPTLSPMQLLAWFTPMALGGCFLAFTGGWLVTFASDWLVLSLSYVGNIIASLLFIVAPMNPSYWVYIFPAVICETISTDLAFNQVNVFLSSRLPTHQQGIAGGLSHVLIHFKCAAAARASPGAGGCYPRCGGAKAIHIRLLAPVRLWYGSLSCIRTVCYCEVGRGKFRSGTEI